jgi:hypothetical protein
MANLLCASPTSFGGEAVWSSAMTGIEPYISRLGLTVQWFAWWP